MVLGQCQVLVVLLHRHLESIILSAFPSVALAIYLIDICGPNRVLSSQPKESLLLKLSLSETLKALGFFFGKKQEGIMGNKLYVGNMSFKATDADIKGLFAGIGEVTSVNLITDARTGQAKGFGFVEMATEEDAKKAIEKLNGTTFMDRSLSVAEAKPQEPREKRSGGFGGNKGGYGGGKGGFGGGSGYGKGRR